MLGQPKDDSVASKLGLNAQNKFDFVNVVPLKTQDQAFSVTQERLQEMTAIVKFLEKQKHDVKDAVSKQLADEKALNDAMIQGKLIK